jgi:hypothetical protein
MNNLKNILENYGDLKWFILIIMIWFLKL